MGPLRDTLRAAKAIYSVATGRTAALPRLLAESTIRRLHIEGTARDCGREYADWVRREHPGYDRYLAQARAWPGHSRPLIRLLDKHAPHLHDFYAGMRDVAGSSGSGTAGAIGIVGARPEKQGDECTSFSVAPSLTLDGRSISGQNKDTDVQSGSLYVVLRLAMSDCPKILTVAYPGEILGYGFWSTGTSLFRNSLHSRTGATRGVDLASFGLLALSCSSVDLVGQYAKELGITGKGNVLVTDMSGDSIAIEWNGDGVSVVRDEDGVLTHANHSVGPETKHDQGDGAEVEGSIYRMERLRDLLKAEAGRLTAQRAYMALADHSHYPDSICRHVIRGSVNGGTTTSIVAEPARGLLHVTRGTPCSNWPSTHVM